MTGTKTGARVGTRIGMTVAIVVIALLMFGPLLSIVGGGEHRGSATMDLGRGDRVTVLTTVPDPSQAPECAADGPGGATMSVSENRDVFDINGVRFYPTYEFTTGGEGTFQITCQDGALFKTDVTTAGFSIGNLLKGGLPTPVLIGASLVVLILIVVGRRRRARDKAEATAGAVSPTREGSDELEVD